MSQELRAARVRVPCSTSNLGVGFDTLGVALDRYLEVAYEPGDTPLSIARAGTLAELADPSDDLIARTFGRALRDAGVEPTGALTADSEIPIARGLGTSAAAVLAGFDLARAALGLPASEAQAFTTACSSDGHGDNAAPCLWGGLRAVAPGMDGRPYAFELPLSEDVGFAYAAPSGGVSTAEARAALPKLVTHKVAVAQLGRLGALVAGLATADPDLIRIGTDDELHVPFRITLIPNAHNAMVAAGDAGAWAATISGAGSGLIAFCEPGRASDVARAMRDVFSGGRSDDGCLGFALRPDRKGLVRLDP